MEATNLRLFNIDYRLREELLNFKINGKFNSTEFTVYTYLLMTAQYEDNTINGILLKCGQTLTSIRKLSANTGLTEKTVRVAIKNLISNGYIEQHSTRHYTIFTLCHYTKSDNKGISKPDKEVSDTNQTDKQAREDYYNELVQKYIKGTLTAKEKEIFDNWRI